jgi:antitoxin StbD
MDTLLTTKSASLTELREPGKVLDRAGATPVAILNRNVVVAYLVPADAVNLVSHTKAADADVTAVLARRRKTIAPVLDYLEDK